MRVTSFVSGGIIPTPMQGTVSSVLAHTVDFYATFAHLAGAPIHDHAHADAHSKVDRSSGDNGLAVPETVSRLRRGRGVGAGRNGKGAVPPVDSLSLWPIISGSTDAGPRAELPLSIGPPGNDGCSDASGDFADNGGALIVGSFKLIVGRSCPVRTEQKPLIKKQPHQKGLPKKQKL